VRKVAFFVEGWAESYFVERLIQEMAGQQKITTKITTRFDSGNALEIIEASQTLDEIERRFFIQIVNCENDEKVISSIFDNMDSLITSGFCMIVGLRDLYPLHRSRLDAVLKSFRSFKDKCCPPTMPCHLVVAVMEIEAWFIAEVKHFQVMNGKLSVKVVKQKLGIKNDFIDFEKIDHPSQKLNDIYKVALKKGYTKKKELLKKIVYCLDFDDLYNSIGSRSKSLRQLFSHAELIFESGPK